MKFSTGLEMLGHSDRWLKPAAAAKGKEAHCIGDKGAVGKQLVYGRGGWGPRNQGETEIR